MTTTMLLWSVNRLPTSKEVKIKRQNLKKEPCSVCDHARILVRAVAVDVRACFISMILSVVVAITIRDPYDPAIRDYRTGLLQYLHGGRTRSRVVFEGVYWIKARNSDLKICSTNSACLYTLYINFCHQKRFMASKYPQNAFAVGGSTRTTLESSQRSPVWIREGEGEIQVWRSERQDNGLDLSGSDLVETMSDEGGCILWLSDSRVCNKYIIDYRGRRPVFSWLLGYINWCHVLPLDDEMWAVKESVQIHQRKQATASLDGLRWHCCLTCCLFLLYGVAEG